MRLIVEQWAPEYGTPMAVDAMDETTATVDVEVEVPVGEWAPRTPPGRTHVPAELAFVDGVRRVEARVWVESDRGGSHQGLCASYAAGVVRCNGSATVVDARVERGIFCDAPDLVPVETRHGRFGVRPVPGPASGDALSLALQRCMADLERAVSEQVADDCLLVLDGPIRERTGLDHAVGYVKTHHVSYLPATVQEVVPRLDAGQRTPVFLIGDGGFRRWSWYVRLPGDRSHGWAGVVRCELSPDRTAAEVVAIADTCALVLPRFASEAHKDRRAPQNLYPIAGLERELRRRLGDARLLYRALRAAA
ncbi:MAG: hypothetical protein ACLGIC_04805 [Acidimicrobiia bacterium]